MYGIVPPVTLTDKEPVLAPKQATLLVIEEAILMALVGCATAKVRVIVHKFASLIVAV